VRFLNPFYDYSYDYGGKYDKNAVFNCTEDNEKRVPAAENFWIAESELNQSGVERFGYTYGALVIPYKYHIEGSNSFEGNSTVGPYFGFRYEKKNHGVAVKPIIFLGAAVIKVNKTDADGNNDDDNVAGLSYGLGLIAEFKSEFQIGVVAGQDRVSNGSDYEDNGKWWIAGALGFSFGQ
jgi:hypothetical protein